MMFVHILHALGFLWAFALAFDLWRTGRVPLKLEMFIITCMLLTGWITSVAGVTDFLPK